MNFCLEDLSIISTLGCCKETTLKKIISSQNDTFLTKNTSFLNSRSIQVGQVSDNLFEIPEFLSKWHSRNVALLLTCVQPLLPTIERLKSKFGEHRIAVILGSSNSGIEEGEHAIKLHHKSGKLPVEYTHSRQEMGAGALALKSYLKLSGPAYTVSTACSSSAKVFQSAQSLLTTGLCDAVLVGGSDPLCGLAINGFSALELLSDTQANPFSKNRNGINIGEGAALFIMTQNSGGVQLLGVGESSDAWHFSSPEPTGRGAKDSIAAALKAAKLNASDISYVNLHGTGTMHNDHAEALAVHAILTEHVNCSSTKPFTGHTLGASGAIEIAFCWLMLNSFIQTQELKLPVHHYDGEYDPELPKLNLVEQVTTINNLDKAALLSTSFGFGGSNCSVILGAGYDSSN